MKDGLYRVTTDTLCAGFVVEDGLVTECAPILRKNLAYWTHRAEWVTDREGHYRVTDAWQDDGGNTVIKEGKGYEESWHSFSGPPERRKEAMVTYFGMDRASVADLTPFEVAVQARQIAQGVATVATQLGGKPVSSTEAEADMGAFARAAQRQAQAEAEAEPERSPLYGQIEAAGDVDALRTLFAKNSEAFNADAELRAAWKARGKELSANG